jgi:hypothetical protein
MRNENSTGAAMAGAFWYRLLFGCSAGVRCSDSLTHSPSEYRTRSGRPKKRGREAAGPSKLIRLEPRLKGVRGNFGARYLPKLVVWGS